MPPEPPPELPAEVPAYRAALESLYGLARFGEKLDLEGPRALAAALGDPLAGYRSVVIGGTNGKGSTSAFTEALLRGAGLRVGLFTSPHLISFCERVRVDGVQIEPATVGRLAPRVLAAVDDVSFFEATWGLAALAFAEARVDVAIWEVGLGGRLDATNACEPEVSAVVSVDFDHMAVLGDTLGAIAREKAGIFRSGRPALTTAEGAGLRALRAAWPGVIEVPVRADLPALPLAGAHQRRNASLACAVADALGVATATAALAAVRWPGRVEVFGDVVIDCAHNPHGAAALCAWLDAREAPVPVHLIFGAMADKDVTGMAPLLAARAATVTLVTPTYPRRRPATELVPLFAGRPTRVVSTVAEALDTRPADGLTLVAGSCFLAGEARAHLNGVPFPELGLLTLAR